jgi:hypothetical protein
MRPAAFEFSVTQSGVEVVQDPKLSKDDRPLRVTIETFDLAAFEFEHGSNRELLEDTQRMIDLGESIYREAIMEVADAEGAVSSTAVSAYSPLSPQRNK